MANPNLPEQIDPAAVRQSQIHERQVGGTARQHGNGLGRRRARKHFEPGGLRHPLITAATIGSSSTTSSNGCDARCTPVIGCGPAS